MIEIKEATFNDNEALINLTSLIPMKGKISLRIDRNPDFFELLQARGKSKVLIAYTDGTASGCFSVSFTDVFARGRYEEIGYLADLKLKPGCSGILLKKLLDKMYEFLLNSKVDLLFCTAAHGNDKVMPIFGGRAGFPCFLHAGVFNVYQIIPANRKITSKRYFLKEAKISESIAEFYNHFYSRYCLAPVHSVETLKSSRCIAAYNVNGLAASISLVDMGMMKQNVLVGLPFFLSSVIKLLGSINKIRHFINIPCAGEPIRILYIKAFGFRNGHEDAMELLIRKARSVAFSEKYCFLATGIHERDSLIRLFRKYTHFTFRSHGFIASLKGNDQVLKDIVSGLIFEDYSLV